MTIRANNKHVPSTVDLKMKKKKKNKGISKALKK